MLLGWVGMSGHECGWVGVRGDEWVDEDGCWDGRLERQLWPGRFFWFSPASALDRSESPWMGLGSCWAQIELRLGNMPLS